MKKGLGEFSFGSSPERTHASGLIKALKDRPLTIGFKLILMKYIN